MISTIFYPQIYKGDPRTCYIFISAWGSNLGSSGFSHNKNNCGLHYCSLGMETNMIKTQHGSKDRVHICFMLIFTCMVCKNQKPPFKPHGWRCHYMGWYTRSESPLYMYGGLTSQMRYFPLIQCCIFSPWALIIILPCLITLSTAPLVENLMKQYLCKKSKWWCDLTTVIILPLAIESQ